MNGAKVYQKVRKKLEGIEQDPFVRLLIAAVFLATAWQIFVDISDRKDERTIRAEERIERGKEDIARAWSILATKAAGNSGKAQALETLFRAGVSLRGIDLSCETMGGGWDPINLVCDRPVDLTGMNLGSIDSPDWEIQVSTPNDEYYIPSGDDKYLQPWRSSCLGHAVAEKLPQDDHAWTRDLREIANEAIGFHTEREKLRLRGADLRDAKLSGVDFTGASLDGADFSGANLQGANFERTKARAAIFRNSDLSGVRIYISDFSGATLSYHPGSCNTPTWPRHSEKRTCSADNPKAPMTLVGSKLDGSIINFPTTDFVHIYQSSLINSFIDIAKFNPNVAHSEVEFYKMWDSAADAAANSKRSTTPGFMNPKIQTADLSCAVVSNDRSFSAGNSNISGAWFPPRVAYEGSEQLGKEFSVSMHPEGFLNHPGWYYGLGVNWAWSDMPPLGQLEGEDVASCNPDGVRLDFQEGKNQGRSPNNCSTIEGEIKFVFSAPNPVSRPPNIDLEGLLSSLNEGEAEGIFISADEIMNSEIPIE